MMRVTPVVKNLIIINVIVFVAWLVSEGFGDSGFQFMAENFWLFKSDLIFDRGGMDVYFRPVQLITYFFSHNEIWHIAFNMLALASLGPAIESAIGSKRFFTFYMFTGLMSAVLIWLFDPSNGPVLGASGAITGILAAFAYMYPRAPLSIFFLPPIEAKKLAIGVAVISAGFILFQLRGITDGGGISHFGHLMGMVAAVIYFYAEKYLPFLPK
ncbi:MAG: rhomboid family intramembrane serine protease [Bacteroidota bacterium]